MKNLFLIFALAALLVPVSASADDAAPAACTLKQFSSLPMTTDPDGRVTIPALVATRPVHLLVDTGGVYSTLSSAIVDELQLKRQRAPGQILAGNIPIMEMADVDGLTVGHQRADHFRFMVMPDQTLSLNDDGLIGANVLKFYDVEFDFAHSRLNLFSQDHCKGAVIYWTKQAYAAIPMQVDGEWHIAVPVTLNGKAVTAIVDSGAAHSIMTLEEAKELFGIDTSDPAMKSVGQISLNGTPKTGVYRYPFSTLTLQGVTVNNPDIDLVSQQAFFRHGGPQLLLGVGVLRQLRVYIAYGEQILYVTPAEAR